MIDINLVPQELRKQRKGHRFLGQINIPLEIIIGCGGGLLVMLGLVHVIVVLITVGKVAQHKTLQYQWDAMKADKENVDSVIGQLKVFEGRFKVLDDLAKKGELSWAHKLNLLSDHLPRGMWFKKVALDDKMLFIEGSTISQGANEIVSVGRLISNLKRNKEFMQDFSDLEVGSIQRRRIKNVEIADFVITMKLQ